MTIERILSLFATMVSVVAVPASGYLSYRFAVIGEKRKEWNAIAEPLLEHYETVAREAKNNQTYSTTAIPVEQVDKIQRRMRASDRKEFRLLVESIISLRHAPPSNERNAELRIAAQRMCDLIRLK